MTSQDPTEIQKQALQTLEALGQELEQEAALDEAIVAALTAIKPSPLPVAHARVPITYDLSENPDLVLALRAGDVALVEGVGFAVGFSLSQVPELYLFRRNMDLVSSLDPDFLYFRAPNDAKGMMGPALMPPDTMIHLLRTKAYVLD